MSGAYFSLTSKGIQKHALLIYFNLQLNVQLKVRKLTSSAFLPVISLEISNNYSAQVCAETLIYSLFS